jgi:hypothetical protein
VADHIRERLRASISRRAHGTAVTDRPPHDLRIAFGSDHGGAARTLGAALSVCSIDAEDP